MRRSCLGGCSAPPCVRGACGRFGGLGPVPGVVSLPFPPSRPACPALRVASPPVRVSPTLARWYTIPRGLCVPRARSGCPSGSPRVLFACVCARAPAASAPPSPGWCGVRTSRGPSPRVLPRSLAPSGVLGGGRSSPGSPLPGCCCGGRLRSGALPPPTARPLGGLLGSATHVLWARVCGCGGPTLSPWPACPVGAACRGGGVVGGRSRGGVAYHCCERRLVSGALPPPTACPLGGLPGPTTHWLWVRGGCGRGDPAPTPQRALLRAGFARCGGGMRVPAGGASCLGVGRPGSGALPPPTARPLGGLPGPTTHWLWVRGGASVGTRHQLYSARSCVLWGRHVGAGGGASCPGVGRLGWGALPPPTARPLGGLPGPTTH